MAAWLIQEPATDLRSALREVRQHTLELIEDLSDEQMVGPRLAIVNPLRWEVGHVGYFQEFWVLRHFRKRSPLKRDADLLYDSARIPHDTRWDLPLPSKAETVAYIEEILDRVLQSRSSSDVQGNAERYDEDYFIRLGLLHECMHAEAITYTRQTLSYPPPNISLTQCGWGREAAHKEREKSENSADGSHPATQGDAEIPGGTFMLGSSPERPFVFDNEQWAHPVTLQPFHMSRTAVSNAEFAAFVEEGGYKRRELWSAEGWRWREGTAAEHPVYWQPGDNGRWLRRNFDSWVSLEPRLPVIHVNWYEADAYCRWAGRRLPTEAEWEMAASCEPSPGARSTTGQKRLFPWGDDPPRPERANLDWCARGCIEVDALPAGDSAFGCRQMIGNVWEWTATDFGPYPGFSPGPYKEYSAPWFGDHKVLRGGCWTTRSGLIGNTYRNYYQPHRRDVWAGFRTCKL